MVVHGEVSRSILKPLSIMVDALRGGLVLSALFCQLVSLTRVQCLGILSDLQ
jgi:hypothetical protein